ncbi:MAG: Ada metal-binding domain-containing protein [Bacteroidota bacterium]
MLLPSAKECYRALLARNAAYLGRFIVGVKTTGIFCLPTCRARKPKFENCQWFPDQAAAVSAGFRPCKVCRPLDDPKAVPPLVEKVIALLEHSPERRLLNVDLREEGLSPSRVRRAFLAHFQITFHTYQRRWRLQRAEKLMASGTSVTDAAYQCGFESLSGFWAARRRG